MRCVHGYESAFCTTLTGEDHTDAHLDPLAEYRGMVGKVCELRTSDRSTYIGTVTEVHWDDQLGGPWVQLNTGWSVRLDQVVAAVWYTRPDEPLIGPGDG